MTRVLIAAVLALAATGMSGTARADDIIVSGFQMLTGEIDGNVIVLEGGEAIVDDATVYGDVIVEPGGGFWCLDSTIMGNVEGRRATHVLVWWSTVNGDVDARGQNSDLSVGVVRSTVGGNVTIKQNDAAVVYVDRSVIAGDVQLIGNYVPDPNLGIYVMENEIGGDLKCRANDPVAKVEDNIVGGHVHIDD